MKTFFILSLRKSQSKQQTFVTLLLSKAFDIWIRGVGDDESGMSNEWRWARWRLTSWTLSSYSLYDEVTLDNGRTYSRIGLLLEAVEWRPNRRSWRRRERNIWISYYRRYQDWLCGRRLYTRFTEKSLQITTVRTECQDERRQVIWRLISWMPSSYSLYGKVTTVNRRSYSMTRLSSKAVEWRPTPRSRDDELRLWATMIDIKIDFVYAVLLLALR